MAEVEWIREMRGSVNFLLRRGSRGAREPNYSKERAQSLHVAH